MKTKNRTTFWIKGLLWFLAISFLFTILSRAADSFTVAKVTVSSPTARKIQHSLTVEGRIEKNREISVITWPDILVKTILVNEGQQVAKGDVLAVLDPDHIEKSIAEIRDERTSLELQNQAAKTNQKQEQKKQEQTIQRAKADYEWLQKQNKKEIQRAKADYKWLKKQNKKEQKQLETALKKTQETLEKSKNDLQKKSLKTPSPANADDSTSQKDAMTSPQESSENQKDSIASLQESIASQKDSIASLQESIESQKKQLAEFQKTAYTEELTAKRALEDAKSGGAEELTAKRALEDAGTAPADDNTIEINNISIRKLDRQLEELFSLQKQKGEILAPADGVISEILVNTGQKTTDTGMFTMTDESAGLKFVGQIAPQDTELLSVGNPITLKHEDQETEVSVTSLEQDEEQDCMIVTALLPTGTFALGDNVTASALQESETYSHTVPLTAIYEDNGKKYILTLEKESTVLGEQEIARKTEVQVVEQNERYAALESETLQEDSQIITDTDRPVKAGDRIRLTEN